MDLQALEKYLKGLGASFKLENSDANLPKNLQDLLGAMPGKAITLTLTGAGITLAGQKLTVEATSTDVWPVRGLGQATVTLASATLTVTDSAANVVLGGGMEVAKGAVAAVKLTPAASGAWSVALDGPLNGVTPTQLVVLGTGNSLPFTIPPKLDLFSQIVSVDPSDFGVTFTAGKDASDYHFNLTAGGGSWLLIKDVIAFNGIDLAVAITPEKWLVTVTGHGMVATVGVDLVVGIEKAPELKAVVQPAEGDTFPGIVEFANWVVAGGDLGHQTTEGFGRLGLNPNLFDIALSKATLTFEPKTPKVTDLEILSVLTILGLKLDLKLSYPALTLAGNLADEEAVKVVDMLEAADLPTDAVPPSLTIKTAEFSAAPKKATYSFKIDVTGIWTEGPVQLQQIKLGVDYANPKDGDKEITGEFQAIFLLAEAITLQLSAKYEGAKKGWTFLGGTLPDKPIVMEDVIKSLGKWDINEVPEPLRSLKLDKLTVQYQTGTKTFGFECEGKFEVEETEVEMTFSIDVERTEEDDEPGLREDVYVGKKGFKAKFGGQVKFGELQFDLTFSTETDGPNIFVADFLNKAKSTTLASMVKTVAPAAAADIPEGITFTVQEVKFVFLKQKDTAWAFGVRLGETGIPLRDIPVIGHMLPEDETIGLESLQMLYTSAAFTDKQVKVVNAVLPKGVTDLPKDGTGKGIAISTDVVAGSFKKHLEFGVKPPKKKEPEDVAIEGTLAASSSAPASASDPIKWVDVNKQIKVFSLQRVGVGYQNNVLEFALDASLAVGPMAFAVTGLTIGSPLSEFKPVFGLTGLSVDFNRPPVNIGGSFLRVTEEVDGDEVTSFYGQLIVKVSKFGLKAVGGWTPKTGSFFIYLSVNAPLGGPPFLFVTGVAGGFGINSALSLPTIDDVASFPLLPTSNPPAVGTPAQTIANAVAALGSRIKPEKGQYWIAAGISFTSFEMVQAQAVITVSFGVETEIGIVGTCTMTFPTGTGEKSPIAFIQIDLIASFTPSTGLLAVQGQLNPASNLFGGFVKLSGGFAFFAWFSGPHGGDFVVTLGGYSPAYIKPDNYPVVPRLQIAFALGPLKVVGQAYFALTPGALMAGIRLTATFELGPIKAWFDAGVDFLIAWAPFYYDARAFIYVGCSIDLGLFTISIQIGADLEIFGPDFGGTALVDLDIFSFTIAFGAERSGPPPVGWTTFRDSFLPASGDTNKAPVPRMFATQARAQAGAPPAEGSNIIKASVENGLLREGQGDAPGQVNWIIDPDRFSIVTSSTIPANHVTWAVDATEALELPNVTADYDRTEPSPPLLPMPEAVALATAAPAPITSLIPEGMHLSLPKDVKTAGDGKVWADVLHIGPMDDGPVDSYHQIAFRKADRAGNFKTYFAEVSVEPLLTPSNTALWAEQTKDKDPNAPRLIEATLTGLRLTPVPRNPAQIAAISMLALIYGPGHETGYGYQDRVIDDRYNVASKITGTVQEITVTGAAEQSLQNDGMVLTALADPWVTAQRDSVLDQLSALGFQTTKPAGINIDTEATQTVLTAWPKVAKLGEAA
ncbi:DUF6603 domain-containing protein [Gymnodinialimonas sp.]